MLVKIMGLSCIAIIMLVIVCYKKTLPTDEEISRSELLERILVPKKDKPVLMAGETHFKTKLTELGNEARKKAVCVCVWIRDKSIFRGRNDKEET